MEPSFSELEDTGNVKLSVCRKYCRSIKMIAQRKWWIVLSMCAITFFLVKFQRKPDEEPYYTYSDYEEQNHSKFTKRVVNGNWRQLTDEERSKMSTLGRILFLEEEPPKVNTSRTYEILVWKYGQQIEPRHLKRFTNRMFDPFEHCSVNNCVLSYDERDLTTADLVLIHLHQTKNVKDVPKHANLNQIFAFLTDESPYHTFLQKGVALRDFNGVFNWSMMYRMDADIPVPYGRTVPRRTQLLTSETPWKDKRRDVLVAALGSDCSGKNSRWKYVENLKKHIKVDFYGKCGTLSCPGNFKIDCPLINDYMFYLAFENSNCAEYYTEKVFWNAYHKNAIPVVMGHPTDYRKVLPPGSYLNTAEFAQPQDLAKFILYLNRTEDFAQFYAWKKDYEVLNEHGYFRSESFHYCRACEALNYNKRETKVYNKLEDFWSVARDCTSAWNG